MPDLNAVPQAVWWSLSGASMMMFVGSLVALRVVIVRMPADYFVREQRHGGNWLGEHPALRLVATIVKNVVGLVLLTLGIIMLVTPGQGVLLILIGVSLLDIPGKRAIERRIVGNHTILRTLNHIRERSGKPPIQIDEPPRRERATSTGADG